MKLTAKEKVRYALDRVRDDLPIAVPLVLAKWEVIEDDSPATPTAKTNGKKLWYNPNFINSLTLDEVTVLMLHEAGHPLYNHPLRFRLWLAKEGVDEHSLLARDMHAVHNEAADLALNSLFMPMYKKWNGLSMIPKGTFARHGVHAGLPEGKSLDYYLSQLWDAKKKREYPPEGEDDPQEGEDGDECDGDGDGSDGDGEGGDKGKPGDSGSGDGDGEGDGSGDGSGEGGEGKGDGSGDGDAEAGDGGGDGGGRGRGKPGEGSGSDSGTGKSSTPKDRPKTKAQERLEKNIFGTYDASPIEDDTKANRDLIKELEEEERDWKRAVASAVVMAKDCGDGAGDSITESLRDDALVDQPDDSTWILEVQRFLTMYAPGGYTYNQISRRHAHRRDLIMPAAKAKNAGRGLVIVDTSGSMGDAECNRGLVEMERFLIRYPNSTVQLISCDSAVYIGEKYTPSDFPLTDFEGWKGRGGTDLTPAFKYAEDHRTEYDWLICITDMEWGYNTVPNPGIPTFWLHVDPSGVHHMYSGDVPFGVYCAMAPALYD